MANITPKRNGEFLKVVFGLLDQNPDGVQAKSVLDYISKNINLSDFERGSYESDMGRPRYEKIVRFATIPTVKAGWMIKGKGTWRITDEGRSATKMYVDPENFYREAYKIYQRWKSTQETLSVEAGEDLDEVSPTTSVITLEEAQEKSWEQIQEYLANMDPYEFQYLVGDLLTAMGYYVDWIAPPGPDKGLDIVAFRDPLGAEKPRIVVQVKHRGTQATNAKDLREFLSVIGSERVGIYVSSAGFTRDAEEEARGQESKMVTLVDLEKLFDLWIKFYEKLSLEARNRLPLEKVYYLSLD